MNSFDDKSEALSTSVFPGSTGILEVALPSRYREKNIKETEAARNALEKKLMGVIDSNEQDGTGTFRYALKRPIDHVNVGVRTDDRAFSNFRKKENNSRR